MEQGNIYVVEKDRRNEEPTVIERATRILKYDSNGVLLAVSDWDNEDGSPYPGLTEPDRGYFNATGIVYSETSNQLYVATQLLGLRIRISNTDNMTPYGLINSGEVEDYLIGIECASIICVPISITILKEE